MSENLEYQGYKKWRNGSRVYVHTEGKEQKRDVVTFVENALAIYRMQHLTFDKKNILQEDDNTFVVTMIEKNPGGTNLYERMTKKYLNSEKSYTEK